MCCMEKTRLTPEKANRIITVRPILHELCKQRNISQPEEYEVDGDHGVAADAGSYELVLQTGLTYRERQYAL